jgi:CMP/dCMP kinase
MTKPIEAIIDRQIRLWELKKRQIHEEAPPVPEKPGPIITFSRQKGASGSIVAQKLAELTGFTLIGRDIIDQIGFDIGAQTRLIESLDESVRSRFELWVEGLFKGRIIDSSDYLKSLAKIIGVISHHGRSIIVGRGANIILGNRRGFHVRIVADYQTRINSLVKRLSLSESEAKRAIEVSDEQRRKFIKTNFSKDIDDPHGYDMVMNSTFISPEHIAETVLSAFPLKDYGHD